MSLLTETIMRKNMIGVTWTPEQYEQHIKEMRPGQVLKFLH